ncbi:PKS-ER domain-containing protein [Aphelenchoides besseyi]|nr:PKS-ER domain-containing protein [Aphelenchoides besseyi]KAI6211584.1 PKS-ER domain-containing protein [Aphelenchoides besseyi]
MSLLFRSNPLVCRLQFVRRLSAQQLVYEERGDPAKILRLEARELKDDPGADEVLVKWRAAPVNPADINQLQGVYPVKPELPAVGGNEGCGWVQKIGSNVSNVREGDLVIPARSGLGTWRTHGMHKSAEIFPLDSQLDRTIAAMFQVNPPTAYRMLHDFVELKGGDTVVQNGANSAVGRYVIQIAKILNLNLINVVRDRPEIGKLKEELKGLGATTVYTEEEFAKSLREFTNVRLALNCVGGRSSLNVARTLGRGGCMVTYGGMSKQAVQCPTGPLIFKNISLRGFWMSQWYDDGHLDERKRMYSRLAEWFKNGELKSTTTNEYQLKDYEQVVGKALETANIKQMFVMSD